MLNCPKCTETFERQGLLDAHFRHQHSDYDKKMDTLTRQYHNICGMSWVQASAMAHEKLLRGAKIPEIEGLRKKKTVHKYESEQARKDREEQEAKGGKNPLKGFRAR